MPVTFPTPSPSLDHPEHPRDGALPRALRGPTHGDASSEAAQHPAPASQPTIDPPPTIDASVKTTDVD